MTQACSCNSATRKITLEQFFIWQSDDAFGTPELADDFPFGPNVKGKWTVGTDSGTVGGAAAGNTLTVTLVKSIPADMPWQMAFVLLKSSSDLISRLSIADNLGVPLVVDQVLNVTGTAEANSAYQNAEFMELRMSEDSNVLSSLSNLTLMVSLSSPLLSIEGVGATITLSGLTGFITPSGYVPLLGESAYMFGKGAVAKWSRESGQLVFEGVSLPSNCFSPSASCWLPSRWFVTMRLNMRSSVASGQAVPWIEVEKGFAKDVSGFRPTFIGGALLNRATVSPRIQRASVTQNSAVQGARNNITLSFEVGDLVIIR